MTSDIFQYWWIYANIYHIFILFILLFVFDVPHRRRPECKVVIETSRLIWPGLFSSELPETNIVVFRTEVRTTDEKTGSEITNRMKATEKVCRKMREGYFWISLCRVCIVLIFPSSMSSFYNFHSQYWMLIPFFVGLVAISFLVEKNLNFFVYYHKNRTQYVTDVWIVWIFVKQGDKAKMCCKTVKWTVLKAQLCSFKMWRYVSPLIPVWARGQNKGLGTHPELLEEDAAPGPLHYGEQSLVRHATH